MANQIFLTQQKSSIIISQKKKKKENTNPFKITYIYTIHTYINARTLPI